MKKVGPAFDKATVIREVHHEKWIVHREGIVEEVELNGSIRFRVTVWDEGRPPFLFQWFNDVGPAADFLDKMVDDGAGRLHEVTD
jgi:hypothetical protein